MISVSHGEIVDTRQCLQRIAVPSAAFYPECKSRELQKPRTSKPGTDESEFGRLIDLTRMIQRRPSAQSTQGSALKTHDSERHHSADYAAGGLDARICKVTMSVRRGKLKEFERGGYADDKAND